MAELSPLRAGRITGSAVGAILGLSPFMSSDDIMRRMVREYHGATSEFEGNQATEWGHADEAGAIVDYTMQTGNTVKPSQFYMFEDWLGATPDGEVGLHGLIEVKCPFGLRNGGEFKGISETEQGHYYAQLQIEMLCAEKIYVDFYQWSPEKQDCKRVDANLLWLTENMPKLKAFYDKYLVERELPNAEKYLDSKEREAIDNDYAKKMVSEYDYLTTVIDNAESRKKEVLAELVKLANEKDATICERKLTKVVREGAVSYAKAFKDLMPFADLSKYKGKASEYWKFS